MVTVPAYAGIRAGLSGDYPPDAGSLSFSFRGGVLVTSRPKGGLYGQHLYWRADCLGDRCSDQYGGDLCRIQAGTCAQ